jgi:hypothetical protein
MITASALAPFALIVFLPITLFFFVLYRNTQAAIGLVLAAMMFLPVGYSFDFEGFPRLHKANLPYLYLLIASLLWAPKRLRGLEIGRGPDRCMLALMLCAIPTALLNQDPLAWADGTGTMSLYDISSLWARDLLTIWIPLFLGRAFVRNFQDLRWLLVGIVVAGLVYSLFCLVEIRLSPQLHRWVYGYHQAPFGMTMRLGGWRPNVFMTNGMALGVFIATAMVAALTLMRAGGESRYLSSRAGGYLGVILLLVKSSAAIIYGLTLGAVVAVSSARRQRTVLVLITFFVVSYPVARLLDLVPTAAAVAAAEVIDADRAQSIAFRFSNEDKLLVRALERPIFGWGTYGRNMVYDRYSGRNRSVTDGYWIILLGTRGAVGLAAVFGVVLWPVVYACRNLRRVRERRERFLLVGTAVLVVIHVMDWLPNGLFTNFSFFLSGGLWSVARNAVREDVRARRKQRRLALAELELPDPMDRLGQPSVGRR